MFNLSKTLMKSNCFLRCLNDNQESNKITKHLEKTYLDAVNKNGFSLKYIKNQNEKICLAAIEYDEYTLKYVKNQTDKICLAAIEKNGLAIKYVKKKTVKKCLAAIKQNGMAIKYIKNKSYNNCMAAVEQNGLSLKYIDIYPKSLAIYKAAVKQNGMALKYVSEKTQDICNEAVLQNIKALNYVFLLNNDVLEQCLLYVFKRKPPTYEDLKMIVDKSIRYLKYIDKQYQTEQICLYAIEKNINSLFYIKNQTDKVIITALEKNYRYAKYVNEPDEKTIIKMTDYDFRTFNYIKNIENISDELLTKLIKNNHIILNLRKIKNKLNTINMILSQIIIEEISIKEDCSICLISLPTNTVVQLNCKHLFHFTCIAKWLNGSLTCPMCRSDKNIF